jgi:NodT family efflux transporter outer membrane factor (OMF) lipoprotein
MNKRKLSILVMALAMLAGCATGHEYQRPQVTVPQAYQGASTLSGQDWIAGEPADAAARGPWWHAYGDHVLDALENKVGTGNQSVQKTLAQLMAAKSQVNEARAGYAPVVGVGVAADRSRTSANVLGKSLAGQTVPDYFGALDISWEPDLWGRIGHTVDLADANFQAGAAELAAVELSAHAELAIAYFNVRVIDEERKILDQSAQVELQVLDMARRRYAAGLDSQAEVEQAQMQAAATQLQASDLGVSRANYVHAIATLIGEPASNFKLEMGDFTYDMPKIPLGLPSVLLQRRPDIAAAERRVAAANASIGIAQSAFYPNLVLSAGAGFESSSLASLLTAPSRMWALGPALIGTLFDGGARHARLENANAQFDVEAAAYRLTVLSAFQQVEDQLSTLAVLTREAEQQQQASRASRIALALNIQRFDAGAVSAMDMAAAEVIAFDQIGKELNIRRRQFDASVMLVKALGGDWKVAQ